MVMGKPTNSMETKTMELLRSMTIGEAAEFTEGKMVVEIALLDIKQSWL